MSTQIGMRKFAAALGVLVVAAVAPSNAPPSAASRRLSDGKKWTRVVNIKDTDIRASFAGTSHSLAANGNLTAIAVGAPNNPYFAGGRVLFCPRRASGRAARRAECFSRAGLARRPRGREPRH